MRPFHCISSSSLNERKVALLVRVDWKNVVIWVMRDTGQMTRMHICPAVHQFKHRRRNIQNIFMECSELFQ